MHAGAYPRGATARIGRTAGSRPGDTTIETDPDPM